MIKSLEFTGKGKNDYITKTDQYYVKREGVSDEEYEEVRHKTHARGPKWEKVAKLSPKYNANPHLIKNLLNRKFEFESDKINIIFGPNASGKTTILKALAAGCMCGLGHSFDGFTNLQCYCPENMNIPIWSWDDKKENKSYIEILEEAVENRAGNQFKIEWDGYPVYYENTASRRSYSFGDLEGGLIENGIEEIQYIMCKNTSSAGQTTIWMINKLTSIAIRKFDDFIKNMFESVENRISHVNDIWANCYKSNIEYYNRFYKEGIESKMTILLDEMDKSLDINNVVKLYIELLPNLIKKYPIQIILISHNPIILSKNIRENSLYNIISINNEYTNDCINNLNNILF